MSCGIVEGEQEGSDRPETWEMGSEDLVVWISVRRPRPDAMKRETNRIGERHGRWVILGSELGGYRCRCDCGTEKFVSDSNLIYGKSKGCVKCRKGGCGKTKWMGKSIRSMGLLNLYNYWRKHRSRMCTSWGVSFRTFYDECGQFKSARSLRSLDTSILVGPNNYKWGGVATRMVEYEGKLMSQSEAARAIGITKQAVSLRVRRAKGFTHAKAKVPDTSSPPAPGRGVQQAAGGTDVEQEQVGYVFEE